MAGRGSHTRLSNTSPALLLLWVPRLSSDQHKEMSSKETLERLFLPERKGSLFLPAPRGMLASRHDLWMNHEGKSTADRQENHSPYTAVMSEPGTSRILVE